MNGPNDVRRDVKLYTYKIMENLPSKNQFVLSLTPCHSLKAPSQSLISSLFQVDIQFTIFFSAYTFKMKYSILGMSLMAASALAVALPSSLAPRQLDAAHHLVSIGGLEHSGAGENLYMSWGAGSADALVNAVGSWNSEKELYNGEILDENNYMIFGHYSTSTSWRIYIVS
jgi:hypothetical protein